jgi:hypothetical protein
MSVSRVVAVIATFRRATELARLLASLEKSTTALHGVVVADNAGETAIREVVASCTIAHRVIAAGENLGCGGGLRLAEETAQREFPEFTHAWVLDDDVVPEPGTLGTLLEAMAAHGAGSACPIAHDADGRLNWFPGLRDRAKFNVLRRAVTPEEYLSRSGPASEAFSWATGVALLVSRDTLERAGLHRGDFWMRGEDLDFSLRVTAAAPGLFVPTARVAHLPPGGGRVVDDFAERMKHAAMLQNCAYLAVRTRHGRSLAKHWPGNAWRHLRRFGLGALGDVLCAAWLGAVRGWPAGSGGSHFRRRLENGSARRNRGTR